MIRDSVAPKPCQVASCLSLIVSLSLSHAHTHTHTLSLSLSVEVWSEGQGKWELEKESYFVNVTAAGERRKEREWERSSTGYREERLMFIIGCQNNPYPILHCLPPLSLFPSTDHTQGVNCELELEQRELRNRVCIQIALYQYVTVRERHKECERERQRIHVYWLSVTVRGKVLNIVTSTISAAPNLETFHLSCWHILRENNF